MSVDMCFACFVQVRFADEKFFSLLAWFPSTIHLSLLISEVSYKSLISHMTSLFLSSSTSALTTFVCETFLD